MNTPSENQKSIRINVRINPKEKEMLDELAKAEGMTVSDYLRYAIRENYKKLQK